MSHTYSGWKQQVAGERIAGQPLDTIFWDKWSDRYQAHRQRELAGWKFGESHTFVGNNFEVLSETTEIYIPPYAVRIVFSCFIGVTGTFTDPEIGTPVGGQVNSRFKIGSGSDYSGIAGTRIGCKIVLSGGPDFIKSCAGPCSSCDGDENGSGSPYKKSHLFTVPEAMKDTVQAVQVEFQRGTSVTIAASYNSIASNYPVRPWSIVETAT